MKHTIQSILLTDTVEVALVGCGGNGSLFLSALVNIDRAMRELGHPGGLHVTVFDFDKVSESNIGRQNFYPSDKGQYKAPVSVSRVNIGFGLNWKAVPEAFPPAKGYYRPHIIVGCVDTKKSRRAIAKFASANNVCYWLDLGNGLSTGQVILGEPLSCWESAKKRPMRLPTVTDLFPSILDDSIPEDDSIPTCSLREALEKQDLFVNRATVTWGSVLLWHLLREGGSDFSGHFINLKSGMVTSLAADPAAWARFKPAKPKRVRKKPSVAEASQEAA